MVRAPSGSRMNHLFFNGKEDHLEKMMLGTGAFMLTMMISTLIFSRVITRRAGNREK